MSHHYFSKDFTKRFRDECELYTSAAEYQHGNLLVKQYTGDDEMDIIGEKLSEKFFNNQLINQIILTLKNEAFPVTRRLFNNVMILKKQCEAQIQTEPYTARYYNKLITMLNSFSVLINNFYQDFNEHVCGQLTTYYAKGSAKNIVAESASLIPVIELTDIYQNNISAYYNYFVAASQYEMKNDNGIALDTLMADYLKALELCTEEIIACNENTRSLMLAWEAQMQIKEEQELYN